MLSVTGVIRKYQYDQKAAKRLRMDVKDWRKANNIKQAMEISSPFLRKMQSEEKG